MRTQAALRDCAVAISHPSKDVVHLGRMLWVKYEEGCTLHYEVPELGTDFST
jgi:hypothetical protein